MGSTELRVAAQQALEALQNCANGEDDVLLTRDALAALRAALAEPVQQGCDHCNHPLYAAIKCRVCGRVTQAEPVQEPVAWLWQHRETGRTRVLMPDERTATDVAAAWDVVGPLYLAPPQRKPLTEEEIDIICASKKIWGPPQHLPLTEEEIGIICASLGFAQISPVEVARAIERAHGIGGQP